jgi:hypothetical protein
MRAHLATAVTVVFLFASTANASTIRLPNAGDQARSPVQLVVERQDRQSETLTQRIKRAWRDLTGYHFDVACPIFPIPLTRSSCTATGKNVDEARAKCQAQNQFCAVSEARRS